MEHFTSLLASAELACMSYQMCKRKIQSVTLNKKIRNKQKKTELGGVFCIHLCIIYNWEIMEEEGNFCSLSHLPAHLNHVPKRSLGRGPK